MSRVVLAPNRDGIILRVSGDEAAVIRQLRASGLPMPRRHLRSGMQFGFEAASSLLAAPTPSFDWDQQAQRAVENRDSVRRRAPDVFAEVRRLQRASPEEVRAEIADSHLDELLDAHQARNVALMTVRGGWGACVFDEQGTGKTIATVAAFDLLVERNEADLLLVVAPKSMIAEWATEFNRFAAGLYGVAVADGSPHDRVRAIESGADVVVINYETAVSLAENLRLFARRARVVLAVDESFAVKNADARRTAAIADLREWCTRAYVLCGTPAPNTARDVIAQFDLVDFGFTFAGVRLDPDPVGASRQIRAAMDSRGIFTRNLKVQVLPHLPQRTFTELPVAMAPVQRDAYEATLDGLVRDIDKISDADFNRGRASYLARRTALLRICSNPAPLVPGYDETPAKLVALDRLLEELIEVRGEKVVLWSFYRASLDAIARRYERYGLARIDGSVDVRGRREAVRSFQEDAATMLFVGNPAAGGAGITLHNSRVAVYESLSNQAAHYLQSLDRIHRRGQEREVEYLALICRGTIEELEYARLIGKADAQSDLLGDPPSDAPTRQLLLEELLDAKALLAASG